MAIGAWCIIAAGLNTHLGSSPICSLRIKRWRVTMPTYNFVLFVQWASLGTVTLLCRVGGMAVLSTMSGHLTLASSQMESDLMEVSTLGR